MSADPTLTRITTGNEHPATADLRDLHPRVEPASRLLQLPPPPAAAGRLGHLAHLVRGAERRAVTRDIPQLRDPLLHRHLHLDRVPARPDRSDTGLRRGSG